MRTPTSDASAPLFDGTRNAHVAGIPRIRRWNRTGGRSLLTLALLVALAACNGVTDPGVEVAELDVTPGDRISGCEGLMKPVGLKKKSAKGFQIVFKCLRCGTLKVNRIAENDVQSDDLDELLKLPPM